MSSLFDPNNLRDVAGLILFILLAYCAGFWAGWWFRGQANNTPLDQPDYGEGAPDPIAYDSQGRHDH